MARLLALATCFAVASCGGGGDSSSDAGANDAGTDARPPADARPTSDAAIAADAMPPPLGASCANPVMLTGGESHSGTTNGYPHSGTGTCSPGTNAAGDAVIAVELGATNVDLLVDVTVDETSPSPYDVVLHARTGCADPPSEAVCRDAGWSERIEMLEVANTVYVFVDGTSQYGGTRTGDYELTTSVRSIAALDQACDPLEQTSRCLAGHRCVGATCVADSPALACSEAIDTGTPTTAVPFAVTRTSHAYGADNHQGSCRYDQNLSAPEHIYRVVLSAPGSIIATTDLPATNFDTVLYLRGGGCDGPEVGCADDVATTSNNFKSTLSAQGLDAGTYYLVVDGSSAGAAYGTYALSISVEY